jgi:RecB family endonuclease NucS
VRLLIARCSVDYVGRLTAHLPMATRLLMVKADGSVLVHSDGGSYKPLNWMSPPCSLREEAVVDGADSTVVWTVTNKAGEQLVITIEELVAELSHDLGIDPGLVKDGVEAHLQVLLAEHIETFGDGYQLVRREYPTAVGPVDIMARDPSYLIDVAAGVDRGKTGLGGGRHIAIEIKRRAGIDAVEQLTRYLDLLNRDPLLAPVGGVLAAQTIAPQARTLAEDRGIRCVVVDYDELRGLDDPSQRLF